MTLPRQVEHLRNGTREPAPEFRVQRARVIVHEVDLRALAEVRHADEPLVPDHRLVDVEFRMCEEQSGCPVSGHVHEPEGVPPPVRTRHVDLVALLAKGEKAHRVRRECVVAIQFTPGAVGVLTREPGDRVRLHAERSPDMAGTIGV